MFVALLALDFNGDKKGVECPTVQDAAQIIRSRQGSFMFQRNRLVPSPPEKGERARVMG